MHGDVVCEALTSAGALTRILMLTASATIDERVEGLALGADDYLPKPFAMSELVAVYARSGAARCRARPSVLVHDDVWLDPARRRAGRAAKELRLTNREFALLEQLLMDPGATLSAETLLDRVRDDRIDPFSNIVRCHRVDAAAQARRPRNHRNGASRLGYRLA